ncbi:hypothetical protein ACIBH1_19155 [Nonomuraea sp. NPDC050663]|uniref:hypothetical protein n=1 Tax=Nonomuraea sp. NPDC050663 TaxID=3364370 RepID=UPI0037BD11F0
MTAHRHDEVITIPRDEYEALKAEVRRLRREVGRQQAMRAIMENASDPSPMRTFTRDELAAEWGIKETSRGGRAVNVIEC